METEMVEKLVNFVAAIQNFWKELKGATGSNN